MYHPGIEEGGGAATGINIALNPTVFLTILWPAACPSNKRDATKKKEEREREKRLIRNEWRRTLGALGAVDDVCANPFNEGIYKSSTGAQYADDGKSPGHRRRLAFGCARCRAPRHRTTTLLPRPKGSLLITQGFVFQDFPAAVDCSSSFAKRQGVVTGEERESLSLLIHKLLPLLSCLTFSSLHLF